jgi:hypothetical protein
MDTTTTLLSFYGAILSTVLVLWNIKDRARLKLDAMIGKMHPDRTNRDYLFITMTNIGRRPILVKGWGSIRKRKSPHDKLTVSMPLPQKLPRMLKECEYHIESTVNFSVLDSDVIKIYVWDSGNRKWYLPKKKLRRLRADLEGQKEKWEKEGTFDNIPDAY